MLRVLIVDDEELAREEMRFLLESRDGVEVVGEASSGDEVLSAVERLEPDLILLDEPDSGVDLENIKLVGKTIGALLQTSAGLIITHTGHILNYVNAQYGHILLDGKLHSQLEPRRLLDTIEECGYAKCAECAKCKD